MRASSSNKAASIRAARMPKLDFVRIPVLHRDTSVLGGPHDPIGECRTTESPGAARLRRTRCRQDDKTGGAKGAI